MPDLFFSIIIFLLGTFLGSFLNCVIYRLEIGSSFLKGRSFCPHCKQILGWQDLIPIFSFLFLRGKCRYCRQKISLQYPLVEIATGLLFLFTAQTQLIWNTEQLTIFSAINFCYLLTVICFLIIVFVYDLKHYVIPDKVIYPAIIVAGIWYVVYGVIFNRFPTYHILDTIYAAIGAALFFLLIVLISRGKWMGVGDIKLAFFMGLFLGWPDILIGLCSAFFIGAVIGIGLMIAGKKHLKSEVPFGPFLVTGTFLALFFGGKLIDWYLNSFLLK